jgi:tetratricopeptide (TPR) repeat protein
MRQVTIWMRAVSLAAAILCATPAWAQLPAPSTAGLTSQEIADQDEVLASFADFGRAGYAGLASHLPGLKLVLDHAPASFPRAEIRGDLALVRADPSDFRALSLSVLAQAKDRNISAKVIEAVNIYPLASLLLASYANEQRRLDDAVHWLDRGLAVQPDNAELMSEKGFTLNQLKRPQEALAVYERGLAVTPEGNLTRPILLRGKGFSLMELGRLDDAERAYQDSLKLEPQNELALNELKIISEQRKLR